MENKKISRNLYKKKLLKHLSHYVSFGKKFDWAKVWESVTNCFGIFLDDILLDSA